MCLNIASAPFGFHLFHTPFGHLDADNRFPFSDQGSNLLLEPPAIPGVQYALPLRGVAAGSHVEIHGLVVANDYLWRALLVNHIEQVTVPLIVVALAANELSCRLALLALKLCLLALDPCQPGNGKEAYSLIIYSQWCSYPYPAGRWIHSKMKILDVLANHINDKTTDDNLVLLSTHLDSSLFQKSDLSGSHLAGPSGSRTGLPAP